MVENCHQAGERGRQRAKEHRKCKSFLWDEGFATEGGAGEKNVSGIPEQMKENQREWQLCVTSMQPLGR